MAGRVLNYTSGDETAEAFVFEARTKHRGSIVVIHEVWGFNHYIEEVCERLCRAGYTAYAPLLYWREKELFSSERVRRAMTVVWDVPLEERYDRRRLELAIERKKADRATAMLLRRLYQREFRGAILRDLTSLAILASRDAGGVGAVGFSMGGGLALRLAAEFPRLRACVAFSAQPPAEGDLLKIRAPLLAVYGTRDEFMASGLPAFVRSAMSNGKNLTLKMYPSAGHEFFDWTAKRRMTTKERGKTVAEEAWRAALGFLDCAFL